MLADNGPGRKVTAGTIKEALRLYRRFSPYVRKRRKAEAALTVLGIISVVFSLINPYLGKMMLDNGILARDASVFFKLTLIGAVLYVLKMAVDKSDMLLRSGLARRVKIRLARDVFRKAEKFSLKIFQGARAGDYVSTLNTDISAASGIIANTLPDFTRASLRLVLITVVIAFIDARILFLVIIYQLAVAARLNYFGKRDEELARAAHRKSREIANALNQIFSQVYFVKASGRMAAMFVNAFRALADSVRIEADISKADNLSGTVSDITDKLFFGIVALAGTFLVIKGQLTLGSLGAVMAYLSMGTGAYSALLNLCQRTVLKRISLERLAEMCDTGIDVKERPEAGEVKFSGGNIEFRGVWFGYEKARPVFSGMNFFIKPGARIGLVGRSGCGKTTIANLILRLYDVDGGAVFLAGRDIRDIRFKSIYGQIGLAPQMPFMWSGTIRSNIAYGGARLGEEEIAAAAETAGIRSFIEALPGGYDTVLGDMVSPMSQGQKQRIAIARAIAGKPEILILDEACSSLDSETEESILDGIIRRFARSTIIMISHRLSAVRKMDAVYFLKRPDKMAVGGHDELMAGEREYRELFGGQVVFPSPCPLPASRGEG